MVDFPAPDPPPIQYTWESCAGVITQATVREALCGQLAIASRMRTSSSGRVSSTAVRVSRG